MRKARWLLLVLILVLSITVIASGPPELPLDASADEGSAHLLAALSGRVYDGDCETEPPNSSPIQSVTVELYGSNNEPDLGTLLDTATTDQYGYYGLDIPATVVYEFYNIVET